MNAISREQLHDLRSQLGVISQATQLLKPTFLDDVQDRWIEMIERAVAKATAIAEEIDP